MGIVFGFLVLALIILALRRRRRETNQWIAEERREEGGDWIDKRAGERGAFGALDAERERERQHTANQGRVFELARLLRDGCFEACPGFNDLNDEQIKAFTAFAREQAQLALAAAARLQQGRAPEPPADAEAESEAAHALKKIILDYAYAQFPQLLDSDLELLRQYDRYAGQIAARLTAKIGQWKK
ncbi:MAG: hypothetical protein IPH12_21950 [Saprospirales bacterium]|nr:hypothetical protein [Saprospirales bacterium]